MLVVSACVHNKVLDAVGVFSVGQCCVIAARRHSGPAENAKTFMSVASTPSPLQFPDLNLMSYFSKLPSLSPRAVLFSCAEQRRVGVGWWHWRLKQYACIFLPLQKKKTNKTCTYLTLNNSI